MFNSYIVYHIVRIYRRLHHTSGHKPHIEQLWTTLWMNIVLVLHSFVFLSSLLSHIVGHFTVIKTHETWGVLLTVLMNSSLNFYIYCLSGKAFRNVIRRFKIQLFQKLHIQQQESESRWWSSHYSTQNTSSQWFKWTYIRLIPYFVKHIRNNFCWNFVCKLFHFYQNHN